MSKGIRYGLVAVGILVCVAGLCIFVGSFKSERSTKFLNDGRAFGQTTDVAGCQSRMVEMTRPIGYMDVEAVVDAQLFFDGCLEEAKPIADFCNDVADPWSDILNKDKGKLAECEKLGLKDSTSCVSVIEKKLDYCRARR